jgi:transposase
MTRQIAKKITTRKQHSLEYRSEALALAEKVGVPEAAKQLGLHQSQLYGWRVKARAKQDKSDLEQSQAAEIARLKRKLAEQAEELAIVKKAAIGMPPNTSPGV